MSGARGASSARDARRPPRRSGPLRSSTAPRTVPVAALGVGAAAFALYLATIAPSITNAYGGSDSGELVSVASVLGVAHGPGYGLYLLLARAALEVLRFLDEPALRTNVLSALLSATAVGVLVLVARRGIFGTPWWAAAMAGVALAVAPVVWEQAILTEVYALHLLLTALALLAALRYLDGVGSLAVAGLALGMLLAHHPSGLLVAAPLGLALVPTMRARRPSRRVLVGAIALGALPVLASIAYLVLRADAPIAWGQTGSARGVWHALSGAEYRGLWEWSPREFARTFPASLRFALLQLPPPLWLCALLGTRELRRARPALACALGLTALALVLVVTMYRADGREPYLAPVAATLALLAAWGVAPLLAAIERWLHARLGSAAMVAGASWASRAPMLMVGALLAVSVIWVGAEAVRAGRSLRGDRSAEEEAGAVLAAAPKDATIHSRTDAMTFALWYLRTVRGQRPDVTIADARGIAPVVGPH